MQSIHATHNKHSKNEGAASSLMFKFFSRLVRNQVHSWPTTNSIFKSTISHADLCMCMLFKVFKQPNTIGAMKTFKMPNCDLCMEERPTMLKHIRDKHVTVMNKNLDIYGACRHKKAFHYLTLSTDDTILKYCHGHFRHN